jgi:mono/diheme cytochrome c family protein
MRAALATIAVTLLLVAAGCGGGETVEAQPQTVEGKVPAQKTETTRTTPRSKQKGNATAGKEIFASAGCGGCHTLSDAGTSGTVGPNLDEAKPSYDLAVDRVTNGQGAMPSFKGRLSQKQIQDVATYVSSTAGT